MALNVGTSFGPYRVLPLEGRGGMAEVYRACDTRLDREVVLKVLREPRTLDARSVALFRREAHLLASLNHTNIAAIYGIEEHDGVQALVLELVEGPTLADRIAQGALSVDQALAIARQVASALEAAHEHGIVHRDVKPSNIKLRPDGTVKVLDFGLATAVDTQTGDPDRELSTATAPLDALAGTTAYMSPEQAQGHRLDKRTDIWAFGCVLFEMLTGSRPFAGANAARTIAAIIGQAPRWDRLPLDVPASCRAVLERCLRKDPADRIRDMGDVRLALDGAFEPQALARASLISTTWIARTRQLAPGLVAAAVAGVTIVALGRTSTDPASLSFELHAPEGSAFDQVTMEPYPTLSPDGRRIAFTARWESRRALWVQTIGTLEAVPIRGTEGVTAPFWSPDGQSIGFVGGDGYLKRVLLTGDRPVQVLSDVPAQWGGAWTSEGDIVFTGRDGLYRIGSDGGAAVQLTHLDASRGEFSHRWPTTIPGSPSQLAFLVRSTQEDARGIHVISLDDPSRKRRIVPDDSNSSFSVGLDGRLRIFFVHDATLIAQPFDPVGGRLTGEPVVVARPVAPGENGRLAPFSAAGSTVVYRRAEPSPNRAIWMNRRGDRLAPISEAAEHRYLTLSPDDARLALCQVDAETGRLDIWVHDLQRRTRERLTRDPVGALFPVWTPDSRTLVYASAKGGPFNVFAQSASANGQEQLLYQAPLPFLKYPSDVAPDGRSVIFQSVTELFRLSLDDGTVSPLLRGIQGRVSPNGRWVAYTSTEAPTRQVYVTTFPEPTERWRISTESGEDPQWRSDGSELFYIEGGQTLVAAPVLPDADFRVGATRPLFRAAFAARPMIYGPTYAVSADGQRFVVLEADREREVLLRVTTNWVPGR
jgi:eukaryotic-like serine/threonine-protein kinase